MEKTLIIIKPDAVEAKCVGKIIDIFETEKFDIIQTEMMSLSDDMLNDHYSHLADKPFFPEIVEFMQSLPVIVMTLQGENAVTRVRDIVGVTDPTEANEGTIRKQFGTDVMRNVVHASDSVENAEAEIERFFG
jgi:nucleoside-diphosphate kinase